MISNPSRVRPDLLEPPLERRQGRLAQVALGREAVDEQPVGDLAGRLRHQRPDRGDHDRRVPVRIGPRVEERRHDRVGVEVAAEVELAVTRPGGPDRPDRKHELAHPRRRLRPLHRVALGDVRLDLGAEAEDEAAARKGLYVVRLQRDGHRVAREGDGDAGADLDPLGALRGDDAGEERVDLRLDGEPAVVAVEPRQSAPCRRPRRRSPRIPRRRPSRHGRGLSLHLVRAREPPHLRPDAARSARRRPPACAPLERPRLLGLGRGRPAVQRDRVGREVADEDVEDLVERVVGEAAQRRLLEDQAAVDDQGEELAEGEQEVEVLDLVPARRRGRRAEPAAPRPARRRGRRSGHRRTRS